ncbi:MAG: amino acid permease [bacterium]|nr:amino acid permease [bacterium]
MSRKLSHIALKRTLNPVDAVGIGLGAIIGAGIFIAIGQAAGIAGSAALISMLIAGVAALFNSLSAAQLAAAYPVSGGTYAYGREVLNDFTGFIAGWVFIIAAFTADSAISLGFASYLAFILPGLSPRILAVVLAAGVTLLNYYGISYSVRINTLLVALKLILILAFIIPALPAFLFSMLKPFSLKPAAGILQAAAVLFFAYTGYARIATLGEEVKDPARNIPRAIMIALGISAGLYTVTFLVALGLIGAHGLAASDAPLSRAAASTGNVTGTCVISAAALIAAFTVILTDIMGVSRVIFAMGRNRHLPHFLSVVHPKHGTPHLAVLASGFTVVLLATFLPLRSLVAAGSFGLLLYYGITNMAAFRLENRLRRYHRIWAVLGFLSCFGLALFLPWRIIVTEMLVIAAGAAYYLLLLRRYMPPPPD